MTSLHEIVDPKRKRPDHNISSSSSETSTLSLKRLKEDEQSTDEDSLLMHDSMVNTPNKTDQETLLSISAYPPELTSTPAGKGGTMATDQIIAAMETMLDKKKLTMHRKDPICEMKTILTKEISEKKNNMIKNWMK